MIDEATGVDEITQALSQKKGGCIGLFPYQQPILQLFGHQLGIQ